MRPDKGNILNVNLNYEYRLRIYLSVTAKVVEIQGATVVYYRYYQGHFVDVKTLNITEFARVYEVI